MVGDGLPRPFVAPSSNTKRNPNFVVAPIERN